MTAGRAGSLGRRRTLAATLAGATALLLAVDGGSAWAFLSAGGAAGGTGHTGTMQAVTVAAATGTPATALTPGGGATDVVLGVANPNAFGVTLIAAAADGAITADAAHPGCTTTGVSFTARSGLAIAIPASQADDPVDLPAAASMSSASSSACQGATFSIPLAITVRRG